MAFNSNELGVIRTYVAITGEAPTQAELQAAFEKTGLNSLATDLIQSRPAQGNTAFVTDLYENLLGRAPDAEGLEYWTSLLSSSAGPNQLSKARLAVEFQNAAALNADSEEGFVDGTAGLTSVNGEFAEPTRPVDPVDPVEDITFEFNFDTTKGASDVAGWTHVKSDETGQISNTTGADDYMSNTNKIYNVGMEAIDQGVGTISRDYTFRTENQLGDHGHYEAYFLSPILDNVTTNLGSVLTVEVIDRMAEANNKDAALSLVAIESFSFRLNGEQVVVGSQDILNAESYEDLAAAIEARINELAEENPALANVSVSLGADFTRQQVDADTLETTGANVLGTQIVVTATGNNLIERGGFAFGEREGGDRNVDPSGRQDTNVLGSETDLVTTNLEFKNVGYGSQGGSVNVSGQSLSDRGVEQFDIVAEKHNLGLGVWLTELSSQPLKNRALNTLEVINLTGTADYFHVGNEQTSAENVDGGTVRDGAANAGITDVRVFNAAQFGQNVRINAEVTNAVIERDFNLGDGQDNAAAENQTFSYNLGNGDNQLYLSFSERVISHEDAALSISTGSGNDRIVLELNNDELAAPSNWYANQKDQKNIVINTGSGNDVVETIGAGDATILTGAGNDVVYTDNSGVQFVGDELLKAHWVFNSENVEVNDLLGGSGAPLAGTSGTTGPYFLYDSKLTVTFSGAGATPAGGLTAANAIAYTNGFEVTVDIPTRENYAVTEREINQAIKKAINGNVVLNKFLQAVDGPNDTLIVKSLVDGEFTAGDLAIDITAGKLPTAASALDQLQAAWEAFNGNSSAGALTQAILYGEVTKLEDTTGEGGYEGATTAILGQLYGTDVTGADSIVESNNVINLGTGVDVIALGTGADSNDTLVYTGYNNGFNAVLNFVQDTDGSAGTASAGVDFLDFTSYLTTQYTVSGSTSGSSINTDLVDFEAAGGTHNGNTVSIIAFEGADTTGQQNWANLTANNLVGLLNGTSAYGDANNTATFDAYNAANSDGAMNTANIIGNTNNHIFLVENDLNDGQYKIFHVTSTRTTDTAGNFDANAQLVGTIDLGASIDVTNPADVEASLVGSAEWVAISGLV